MRGIESKGEFHAFDKVVSTIPLPLVPRVMPDLPADVLQCFQSRRNIAVVCVIVKLRKPVTENFWLNTNDPDMDIPGVVEYTNLRPLDHHVVYVPFYLPGEHPKYQEPDEVFLAKVKRYLMKINPALTEADVKAHCVANLTNYKRPKFIEFRNDLPKSNVGKILRKDLRG